MNSWDNAQPSSRLPAFSGRRFAIYLAQFAPRIGLQKSGGELTLRNVTGKAQVWLDGKLVSEKTEAGKQTISAPLPAGEGERTISVLIEASASGTSAGLGGTCTVE